MNNHTLAIIKPDSIGNRFTGKIIDRILADGFNIIAMEQLILTKNLARKFYDIHKEKSFFNDLVEFMTSGSCIAMVLEKNNAVTAFRELIGATDPSMAKKGTIRHEFAQNIQENAIHGSDSVKNALKEIAFFFPTVEIPG